MLRKKRNVMGAPIGKKQRKREGAWSEQDPRPWAAVESHTAFLNPVFAARRVEGPQLDSALRVWAKATSIGEVIFYIQRL